MSPVQGLSTMFYEAEHALRASGFDVRSYVKDFDFGTLGIFALVAVAIVFAIDALAKLFPAYLAGAAGYGRSLLSASAKAWPGIKRELVSNDPRGRGRSLENLTPVLDALRNAYLKWEDSNALDFENRAL
ncbi:uncharacterized protein LOC143041688 [Oratosquilla oratoria]|uniref:uncharacterized protein LOC143041688 n=1 Tax=Oratosquilla oratoria TaxID=337810 RepID=UPI003F772F85